MHIVRSPVRISFLGGGTDYPAYLNEGNDGAVIGTAINKYSYITFRDLPPFHPHKTYLSYSETERVQNNHDIKHNVIKKVFEFFKIEEGIECIHFCDIPSKSGTGSSSSFLVSLIHAVAKSRSMHLSAQRLAEIAIEIEQDYLKDCVGLQDSVFAAYGNLNFIRFSKNRKFSVYPIELSDSEIAILESHLLLFFTGIERISSNIAKTYVPSLNKFVDQQKQMVELAENAYEIIVGGDYLKLGKLMHKSWMIKRGLSPNVSNEFIDKAYNQAISAGAEGGKICGSGGGGCLLLVCPPGKRKCIKNKLTKLMEIPFKISKEGSSSVL